MNARVVRDTSCCLGGDVQVRGYRNKPDLISSYSI